MSGDKNHKSILLLIDSTQQLQFITQNA